MPSYPLFALSTLVLLLSACQGVPGGPAPVAAHRTAWEQKQPGCAGDSCPLVNIDTLTFPDDPTLTALTEQALLTMTRDTPKAPLPPSLRAYEQQFLSHAEAGWSSYLQAKVREQHDDLVIIELSSYLATGGAHGMPGRGFLNYQRSRQQVLSLQQMLLPGQEEAFWSAVQLAHQAWLKAEKLDQDSAFTGNWPFQRSPNIALTRGALSLKYDVYSIAPYAMGHPELKVPYARLKGILKPEFFPHPI
ncbi:MAG: RsiV family protein [Pseudomonas sp.]|uniref:RsiV family protein n=1 Tax=Pseudomonas sp. TaxID=306 RepID=UPI0033947E0C